MRTFAEARSAHAVDEDIVIFFGAIGRLPDLVFVA